MSEKELPAGWALATLGEVASWGSGGTPKSGVPHYYGGDIPWIVSGDLKDQAIQSAQSTITADGLGSSSAKWVPQGSVLIAMYGATIGKLGIASIPLTTNQAVAFAAPFEGLIEPRFLFWYLRSQRESFRKVGKGGAQPNISQTILKAWSVPIPPLAEQHRIVEALEAHLSRLDFGVATLSRAATMAPSQVRSLNTAATEGRLAGGLGSGSTDFDSVRREVWYRAWGNKKYKEPCHPDLTLPVVSPEGWPILSLESVTDPVRLIRYGILMPKVKSGGTVPYVEVKDLRGCHLKGKQLHLTSAELDEKFAGARIEGGDIVMAVRGSYDRSAVVPDSMTGANVSRDVVRIAPLPGLEPEFLQLYLQSVFAQKYLKKHARGVAVKGVNIASLRTLPVAVPPTAAQRMIIDEVSERLSVVQRTVEAIDKSSAAAGALRRSLLNRAFAGALVPQDPTDEPVTALLARIEAERAAQPEPKRTRRVPAAPRKSKAPAATAPAPAPTPAPTHSVQQEFDL